MKELEADLKITEINIHDKTLLKPSIAAKWARFAYEEDSYKKKLSESIERPQAEGVRTTRRTEEGRLQEPAPASTETAPPNLS